MIKEQNAHLDSLSEMANIKINLFKEIINDRLINAGTGTDKTVPITQIQDFISNLNTLKSYGFHFCRDNKQTVEYYVITNWG
ncbi:hypothetical protein [uncultured Chryseobacterium sp.]|uniref:hypothetical protein n=1 Tax=uncultured Chryseobacterium sp. TaxID=259322 RepID=UPI0025EAC7A2|nr:hypothetical protein [uncultured Chryseobacterium sp.]